MKNSRGDRGQILILTALSMVVLLGLAALTLDVSYMYDKRNRLYAAADAAAKSGAIEAQRNAALSQSALNAFGTTAVQRHGFTPGGGTTVIMNRPPTSGAYAGNTGYVEALVSEPTSTFVGTVLGWISMTPGARAVAGYSKPDNCLITTAPPGSVPVSLQFGNTELTLNGCNAASGGNLAGTNPNATINGTPLPSVTAVGTCSGTCGHMGVLSTGTPAPADPLAGLVAPTNPGGCTAGTSATLGPGCYTSISSSVSTLTGGLYYVTGTFDIGNVTGSNVLIYLTGAGKISADNNKSISLTAQTSGPYTGIAIFQDPADANNFAVGNHFAMNVSGAIYMPGADVTIPNHLIFGSSGCNLFIARSLNIENGSGNMDVSGCAATYGGAPFLSVSMAE